MTIEGILFLGGIARQLFYFPDVVGFQEFCKVVILLGSLYLLNLCGYGVVIGGSLDVADNAQCYGESVAVAHQGELELQGVVLAVCIVYKDILQGDSVLTNLDNLEAESVLNESELMDFKDIELFNDVDVIQIGARNMQNFNLLKEVGSYTKKPILLKRGMSATLRELLMSAEYVMASGNPNVILCERGIRTFETAMRNTLDLGVVTMLHRLSHLPVVVDPSHATGYSYMVDSVSVAATAIGADGLIIEVHNDPPHAKCDGAQSQTPDAFAATMKRIERIRSVIAPEG